MPLLATNLVHGPAAKNIHNFH